MMRRIVFLSGAALMAVLLSSAIVPTAALGEITTVALYRLGEDDAGAVAGNPGNNPTTAMIGADAAIGAGNPAYSANTPGTASTLSMDFDDDGDYYSGPAYDLGTDNWGVEGWVYSTDAGNGGWAFSVGGYVFGQWSGNFLWHRSDFGDVASAALEVDQWHHMALVRDGGTLTAYLDGTALASTNRTEDWSYVLGIGAKGWDGLETWAGQVDQVRLFAFEAGQFNAATDLSLDMNIVPEPTTMSLLGTALLGLVFFVRRKRGK